MLKIIILCIAFAIVNGQKEKLRPLNAFIRHHERLDYNLKDFHSRVRRSTISSPFAISDLHFKAFGKNFHIRLRKDHTIFTPDAKIVDGNGKAIRFDPNEFVEGFLLFQLHTYLKYMVQLIEIN